jgi:hypothetical protein
VLKNDNNVTVAGRYTEELPVQRVEIDPSCLSEPMGGLSTILLWGLGIGGWLVDRGGRRAEVGVK